MAAQPTSPERGQAEPGGPEFETSDRHLRRSMGLTQALFLSVGSIIGSGWLFAELDAAAFAGPAATISWIVGAFFITMIALSWSEVSAALPRSGGLVRYPHLTHGSFTGWILGWAYWVSAVATPAIEAEAVITYLGGRYPSVNLTATRNGVVVLEPRGIGCAVVLMLLFFAFNVFGVRILGEANRWVTWWKIVIPVTTFCFLFTILDTSNFTAYGGFFPRGTHGIFDAVSVSGIVFSFLGFRQAIEFGGETRRPQRDIPIATIGSVAITLLIYLGLQIAMVGAVSWHSLGVSPGDWLALRHSNWAGAPLYNALTAAGVASLASFGTVILIDAGVSPTGTGTIYTGTTIRAYYGLSVDRYAPRIFQWMNRFGIPWFSAVGAFVIGCLFFIPLPSWYRLVGFITSATVLTMVMGGIMVPTLRRVAPGLRRPFELRWMWLFCAAGFLAAVEIIYFAGYVTLNSVEAATWIGLPLFAWYYVWKLGWAAKWPSVALGVVFLGGFVFVNYRGGWTLQSGSQRPGSWPFWLYDVAFSAAVLFFCFALWALSSREGRFHVQRAAWIVWLLLVSFPVSYWGSYGPRTTPALAFPWDVLIELGVGLVAFVWGARSGFETDDLRDIVRSFEQGREPRADGQAV